MDAIAPDAVTNSQDRAYQFLKNSIINLELKPNQKLGAQEVASRLDISRTPVREAFSKLAQEGLLVRQGGWGYAVCPVTFKDAMNIFRMRETLEVEAIKEVIPRLTPERMTYLEAYLLRAEERLQAGKLEEYRVNTRAFYRSIAQATENNILEYMLSLIDDRVRWVGAMITYKHDDRPRESLAENRKILQALKKKSEDTAVSAVRTHVCGARESFLKYVTEEPGPFQCN
jgi:DNA-binding GntR family transcriptional regulator